LFPDFLGIAVWTIGFEEQIPSKAPPTGEKLCNGAAGC